jgi:hypothetical protein
MRGVCMVCAWHVHGVFVVYAWCMRGVCMVCAWHVLDVFVVCAWCVCVCVCVARCVVCGCGAWMVVWAVCVWTVSAGVYVMCARSVRRMCVECVWCVRGVCALRVPGVLDYVLWRSIRVLCCPGLEKITARILLLFFAFF